MLSATLSNILGLEDDIARSMSAWSDIVSTVATLAIAALGFLINRSLRKQEKAERARSKKKEAQEAERIEAMKEIAEQEAIARERASQKRAVLIEFRSEVIDFSARFIDLTSEALADIELHEAGKSRGDGTRIFDTKRKLSAILDEGRFLFPNVDKEGLGLAAVKGEVFDGYRRPELNMIYAVYCCTEALVQTGSAADEKLDEAYRWVAAVNRKILRIDPTARFPEAKPDGKKVIIEARRAFLNLVVPQTLPDEWRETTEAWLGNTTPTASWSI